MGTTLAELARLVDGTVSGDGQVVISGAATLRDVQPGQITLADNPKFLTVLENSAASAVVVPAALQPTRCSYITVADVHAAFSRIVAYFRPPCQQTQQGISTAAYISPTARVASSAVIYPHAYVGDEVEIGERSVIHSGVKVLAGSRLGADVTVFPNAVLYEKTLVGDRVIIHASAIIGAYGFGYQVVDGRHQLSAQLGNVEIGNDVEIGAGTTVDRGTYGPTTIGEGTKIDNQVMVAHNCRIGRHNLLCSQVGIAGSCTTGDYVVMAGQVGIRDHINIGDRAVVCAKAGVMRDIPAGATFLGIPATPEREQFIMHAAIARLPELRKHFRKLEQEVAAMRRAAEMPARSEAA